MPFFVCLLRPAITSENSLVFRTSIWIILSRLQFTVFLPFVIHATVNSFGCLGQQYIQCVTAERMKSISNAKPHSMPKAVKCELYTIQTMELRRSSWASTPNGGGNCRSGLIKIMCFKVNFSSITSIFIFVLLQIIT